MKQVEKEDLKRIKRILEIKYHPKHVDIVGSRIVPSPINGDMYNVVIFFIKHWGFHQYHECVEDPSLNFII